jgi:NAD(P)-dependent dehydrogenase (short-subunit alcohol dehydrogenase family)
MRNPEASPELSVITKSEKLPISIMHMDVDSDESVNQIVNEVLASQGQIDVLVNNAGIPGGGPVEEIPLSLFRQVMETNFFGAVRCIQAVLPSMRRRESGHIVNVSSLSGRIAMSPQAPYAASKWALEAMSEALAQEVARFGIRVSIIEPGIVATAIFGKVKPQEWSSYYPQSKRMTALFKTALQKPTAPSVVAEAIVEIVKTRDATLRHPVGPDANGFLSWRAALTDEQWVTWGGVENDEEWLATMKRDFGMDIRME